jgi:DNA-binding PadR family transcriptional regulator
MGLTSKARASRDVIALTVLALLAERPLHPYEMQRLMRERRKDFAIGKARSFYDAVNRLLRDGLIEPLETSREGKRPERTVYRITAEGREELASWLDELLSTPATEYPLFTVAMNFLACLSPAAVVQALQDRVVALEGALAGLDAVLHTLQEQVGLPRLVLLEHEHTQALRRAELEWVRTIIADIQTGRLTWDVFLDWVHHGYEEQVAGSHPNTPAARIEAENTV